MEMGIERSVCAQAPGSPSGNMTDHQNLALRIVLVGRTGSGKSATANTILGEKKFVSQISAQAITKTCQRATREWKGRELLVVDTPGLFDTKETLNTTCAEISRCVLYSCPGPHAIIMVLQLGRYTMEEQKTVALVKAVFGKAAMKNMIVLFTRKEELEDQSLDSFLEDADVNLKSIIKECGNRYFAISNKADKEEKEVQVQMLVELIEKMVKNNGEAYFSDHIYENIEEKLNRRTEVLKKIYAEERDNEIKLIKQDYATKPEEEKEKQIKSVMLKYEEKIKNIKEEAEKNVFKDVLNMILKTVSRVWDTFWK